MATLLDFWVLKLMAVPQPEPTHRFSPNFQGMLLQEYLEVISLERYPVTTVAMAILLRFFGLKVCGCSTT